MRKRTSLIVAAGITPLVLTGIVAYFVTNRHPNAHAAEIPSAKVATAKRGDIAHTLSLAGQFQPYQVVDIHPKVTGFMVKINVDIGDRVRKEQTLALLEVPELNAQLKGTVYEVQRAKDELLRAQHEIKRAEAIYSALHADYERLLETSKAQPGLIAQQELDDAQSKDLSSESQVDAAKAAAAAAEQHAEVAHTDNDRVQALKNYTNVVAPLDGVIVWRYADTGALIQSGTNSNEQDIPIVRLSQSGLLRLRMPIPENDVQFVHIGDTMQVRVDAIGRSFTGKIVRFTRDVNFETRTMETEIDVENKDLSISPGMYANTQMQLATAPNVTTIPVEALVLKGNKELVYSIDASNRVRIRSVEVGLRGSKLAEIKSGVQPGDRVILGGQESYTEDEEVSPIFTKTLASEVMHESGGVIDMKAEADENSGGVK
ncbi:MAG: efflux RND transporter periplasmic adaptor subunit [Terracidiphilus sp.]|jgi:RND family efflux transporter MFP subunit